MEAPRRSSDSSPEFEFWMLGNHPSSPDPRLLTADELFVDGVLLPLHLLSLPIPNPDPEPDDAHHDRDPAPEPEPDPEREVEPSASIMSVAAAAAAPASGSKRWKDIFKVGDKKPDEKERRKERKGGSAELNINIWPFSRSRSAGTAAARPRASSARNAASAPCSRSNSRGESSKPGRRWAPSPGRAGGVHLGRPSPVWQLRRGQPARPAAREKPARVLSLSVNTCIGYRSQASCRSDDDGAGDEPAGGGGGSMFNLRTLFSKKVY